MRFRPAYHKVRVVRGAVVESGGGVHFGVLQDIDQALTDGVVVMVVHLIMVPRTSY